MLLSQSPQGRYEDRWSFFHETTRFPHVVKRETHQRPLEFSFFSRKRLFQHYLPGADVASKSAFDPGRVKTQTLSVSIERNAMRPRLPAARQKFGLLFECTIESHSI